MSCSTNVPAAAAFRSKAAERSVASWRRQAALASPWLLATRLGLCSLVLTAGVASASSPVVALDVTGEPEHREVMTQVLRERLEPLGLSVVVAGLEKAVFAKVQLTVSPTQAALTLSTSGLPPVNRLLVGTPEVTIELAAYIVLATLESAAVKQRVPPTVSAPEAPAPKRPGPSFDLSALAGARLLGGTAPVAFSLEALAALGAALGPRRFSGALWVTFTPMTQVSDQTVLLGVATLAVRAVVLLEVLHAQPVHLEVAVGGGAELGFSQVRAVDLRPTSVASPGVHPGPLLSGAARLHVSLTPEVHLVTTLLVDGHLAPPRFLEQQGATERVLFESFRVQPMVHLGLTIGPLEGALR